VIPTMCSS
jgi:hypothetical protein